MTKRRRRGYIFVAWKGDHSPHHVHVYRQGRFVVKWDLENWRPMRGDASPRVVKLIRALLDEGLL
jgi:hypothetical protein